MKAIGRGQGGRAAVWIAMLAISASKFYDWRERYGKANEHNGWVPRDFWLEEWEKQAIIRSQFEEARYAADPD